jgi:hypothetical protein
VVPPRLADAAALRLHLRAQHAARLRLPPPRLPGATQIHEAQRGRGCAAPSLHRVPRAAAGPDHPLNDDADPSTLAAQYAALSVALPHVIVVDMANVVELFDVWQQHDPGAERFAALNCFAVAVVEPRVPQAAFRYTFARALLAANRLFIHGCHGGREAGDLVLCDVCSRITWLREQAAMAAAFVAVDAGEAPDGDQAEQAAVRRMAAVEEDDAAFRLRFHLVSNDRRLAECLHSVVQPRLRAYHNFGKVPSLWRLQLERLYRNIADDESC